MKNANGQDAWNEATAHILAMAAKELRTLERRLLAGDPKDPLADRARKLAKRLDKRRKRIEQQPRPDGTTLGGRDAVR